MKRESDNTVESFAQSLCIRALSYQEPVAIVGDLHGCRVLLDHLLHKIGPRPIIVVGDVCDRGPDTRGTIERLISIGAAGVRGNHEEWFLSWISGEGFDDFALSAVMGGRNTLDSYGVIGATRREIEAETWRVPRAHIKWLSQLPFVLDLEVMGQRYWVAHAGIPPLPPELLALPPDEIVPWVAQNRAHEILWSTISPHDIPALGRTIIMGHIPITEPLDLGHVIAIDTSANTVGEKGQLCAVLLPERRFVCVR